MTITGSADWDTALFAGLKAGTYTADQAKALWTYTDGYLVRIQSSTTANFNPNNLDPYLETTRGIVLAASTWNEYEYAVACAGQYAELQSTTRNLPGYERAI
jgi:hypothetical protein